MALKTEGTGNIKEMPVFSFNHPILLTSMDACPLVENSLLLKEQLKIMRKKFLTII